jgi:hypothetical protein
MGAALKLDSKQGIMLQHPMEKYATFHGVP